MNALKLGVIALLMASAAGCSTGTPTAEESEGPPKNGGSYEAPVDLANRLLDYGLECTGLSQAPKASDTVQTSNCTSGGDTLTLRVFSDEQQIDGEIEAFEGTGESMLVGENWTLVGPVDYIEAAHKKLGGDVQGG